MKFPPSPIKINLWRSEGAGTDLAQKAVRGLNRRSSRKSLAQIIGGWLFFIFMLILLCFLVVYVSRHSTKVMGSAMYPTLSDQDSILIDRISYRFLKPGRFDVVVFPGRYEEDVYYIRRIIGLPGETLQIMDGVIYINGVPLKEKLSVDPIANPGLARSQVVLGEDEYFVLGDNRNESSDSREPIIGNIRGEDIIGRAILRIGSLKRFSLLI